MPTINLNGLNRMDIKEAIIVKLKDWIKETDVIDYDEEIGFKCRDKTIEVLRDGKTEKEVYVVSFSTKDVIERDIEGNITSLIEGMSCYAYFNAETLDMLYILKKGGYIEIDGSY